MGRGEAMDLEIPMECPKCHRKLKFQARSLTAGSSRSCPGCGTSIVIKGDGFKKTQDALDDLKQTLGKLGNVKIKL
jgi:DNA-directed RNA polymerase subunit RPC12/RpoP